MIDKKTVTSDKIRAAAKALKEVRPEYEEILNFFEQLFLAQEAIKGRMNLDPPLISENILEIKRKENFPLIEMSEFTVDMEAATALFAQIWELVQKSGPRMSYMAIDIDKALKNGELEPEKLVRAVLDGDDAFLESRAKAFNADKQVLGFLSYNAVKPSITSGAEQLANYLDPDNVWPKGFCPICGNHPGFGVLEGDGGGLSFFCAFCWHKWRSVRLFCPFCESREGAGYQYFYSESEPEYRVYVCEGCKKYVKTLDARVVHRPVYPPLESIATLHLDMKAKEEGLESPPFGF